MVAQKRKYEALYQMKEAEKSTHAADLEAARTSSFEAGKMSAAAALQAAKMDLEAANKAREETEQNFEQATESLKASQAQTAEAAQAAETANSKLGLLQTKYKELEATHAAAIKKLEADHHK